MTPSSPMRWGVVAATAGCVLFSVADPAVVGTFSGQRALRTLGTVALSAGLMVFLAAFLALEVPGVGLTTVFSEAGRSVPMFQRVEGCTLIMCGLDHVLFHLAQIPFLAALGRTHPRRNRDLG